MRESWETRAIENAERDLTWRKALDFWKKNPRVNPRDFSDLYGEQNVERDLQHVEKMEKSFLEQTGGVLQESEKTARVLEAILNEQIELSDWLGPDASTINPSRYDDINNGVDTIVEWEKDDGTSHLAIAVDITYSQNLYKKFGRIKAEIRSGQLAEVKYFYSEQTGFRGKLEQIPHAVIGLESKTIEELSNLWRAGDKTELARHKTQYLILAELAAEMRYFADYARGGNFPNGDKTAQKYEKGLKIIEDIIHQKGGLNFLNTFTEVANDKVFAAIKSQMELKIPEMER